MAEGQVILIVDDDLTLRELYGERLKEEGYAVTEASDGVEAIKKAQEIPSLIILDIMLPKTNGIDVVQKIRSDEKTKNIPFIILTALIQEIDKIKKLMTARDSYLIKSEQMPKDVIEKVNTTLSESETSSKK